MTEEARIDWSENTFDPDFTDATGTGASDFERNLIRFRAEMRAKTAVLRPQAFVTLEVSP